MTSGLLLKQLRLLSERHCHRFRHLFRSAYRLHLDAD
jgi:hypothetical protein